MKRRTTRPPIRSAPLTADSRLGGYRVGDLDAALARSERSDPLSVAVRLAALGAVYLLLARAVAAGAPAQALLLPLLIELLAVLGIGSLIGRWLVDCPSFRQSMGGPIARLLSFGVLLALLASLPDGSWREALDPAWVGRWIREQGLHWPIAAAVGGLLLHSLREALTWRARRGIERGVFVWTSIQLLATRVAVLIVLALIVGIPVALFLPGLLAALGGLGPHAGTVAWCVYGVLLAVDLGAVIVLALMHRDAAKSLPARSDIDLAGVNR